jgi:5'-nucleotidase
MSDRLSLVLVAALSLGAPHVSGDPSATATWGPADGDAAELREAAHRRVEWRRHHGGHHPEHVTVQILAINDFHGQLETGKRVSGRPVGGAGVLAAWLEAARAGREDTTYVVHDGDLVGASPPASALLQDEPTISLFDLFGNEHCRPLGAHAAAKVRAGETARWIIERWLEPRCNLVAALGNHELDEGRRELLRLLAGGDHARGPFLEAPWRGARYPTLAANVVDEATGRPFLPPFVVRTLGGVPVGFIGVILKDTPTIVTASATAGLRFLDEVETVNRYARELVAHGVRAIVVLLHQGGTQTSYTGATDGGRAAVSADVAELVSRLDGEVDVVVSGHRHGFTNALVPNAGGAPVLVTQAFSAGTAFADIELTLDPRTRDVEAKSASIVTTWGDVAPGSAPDPQAQALVDRAVARVAPLVQRVVGRTAAPIGRAADGDGELPLGLLIADAQRAALGADVAFMNPGGVRADLDAGDVTWGELFAVQPFANGTVRMTLTGDQLRAVLAQQFVVDRVLQPAGLRWTYRGSGASRTVVEVTRDDGTPIDPAGRYAVAVNSFLADGGDGFTVLRQGTDRVTGPVDLDALEAWVTARSAQAPIVAPATDRITRVP